LSFDFETLNTDAERKACEIRLRAERRAGELLSSMKQCGERADAKNGRPKEASTETRLSDLGITPNQSSKWQKLAVIHNYEPISAAEIKQRQEAQAPKKPAADARHFVAAEPRKPVTHAARVAQLVREGKSYQEAMDIVLEKEVI
jgi:hypothetical protein